MARYTTPAVIMIVIVGLAQASLRSGFPLGGGTPGPPSSELFSQIIEKYMAGDWDALESDLAQHAGEIAKLSKQEQADIAYIRQALAECHPSWWKQIKTGQRVPIRATVWQHPVSMTYENGPAFNIKLTSVGSQISMTAIWPAADVDSGASAEHGFTKGDLTNGGIWALIEQGEIWMAMTPEKVARMNAGEKTQFNHFSAFRGNLAAAYYGTPRARQWIAFLSLDAYAGSHTREESFIVRKPLGAMLVAEVASHRERYPNLNAAPGAGGGNREGGGGLEQRLANVLMGQFERRKLTFTEDRALRDAIKAFALANGTPVYSSGKITFSNKLQMALDPAGDTELSNLRDAWLTNAGSGIPDARSGASATGRR
jgi:hypothetical protein